jgi:hypothetical protein
MNKQQYGAGANRPVIKEFALNMIGVVALFGMGLVVAGILVYGAQLGVVGM